MSYRAVQYSLDFGQSSGRRGTKEPPLGGPAPYVLWPIPLTAAASRIPKHNPHGVDAGFS